MLLYDIKSDKFYKVFFHAEIIQYKNTIKIIFILIFRFRKIFIGLGNTIP